MKKKLSFVTLLIYCSTFLSFAQQDENYLRWTINENHNIEWNTPKKLPHYDHIEMAGEQVAVVYRYGVNKDQSFYLERGMVWPMLRTLPNDTHASLMRRIAVNPSDMILINGKCLKGETTKQLKLKGMLQVESKFNNDYLLKRTFFPSTTLPAVCEKYVFTNLSSSKLLFELPELNTVYKTSAEDGVTGSYAIKIAQKGVTTRVEPNDSVVFYLTVSATDGKENQVAIDVEKEQKKRIKRVSSFTNHLVLDTPNEILNTMFRFSKVRATESIYKTKGGYMHGPGGESYYAAIWANDQAEYVNPFFPFLGDSIGNESALNSFRHFARFMNDDYNPIPSSIIAEGIDIWNGAGDRGDAAMIAYGAARYSLARGDKKEAKELWKLITWCLEYCKRNLNAEGVVRSDCDELENRFPAGDANLCTSALYYDALLSASYLAKDLHLSKSIAREYRREAAQLRKNIERYFGHNVEGYDTYRYYKENDILRSWICVPLVMGIDERKEATIEALFSNRLWTKDGLLTQAGSETFWDRSTLYALRGVLAVGEVEKAIDFLKRYSSKRLLGNHVPYAIEAWPEGDQRHLSAESGLYARIFTEGLFGIRPTGLQSFNLTPRLPKEWNEMSLNKIAAFGHLFDIKVVRRKNNKLRVFIITQEGKKINRTIRQNQTIKINL